ncbi:helix-turn-helix domain-containing protein [Streptomyces sp. NPDC001549]|uniref:helix-turn-helix domain-containing protein n=1 Tax=Streptomyces sp. NPDC001549 TaxID=3364586 RepID=UPI0036A92AAD
MTDEQKKRRGAVEMGATAATVAANVRRLRDDVRGWSTYELAGRLAKAGRPIAPSAVAKIERGERQVSVDDLMALAVVLGVSPVTLLLPVDARQSTEVTGAGQVDAKAAWHWAWCNDPLRFPDGVDDEEAHRYLTEFLLYSRPIGLFAPQGDDRIPGAMRERRGGDG